MISRTDHAKNREVRQNSTYSDAGYPDRLDLWGELVKNSTKLTCFEIAGYGIKYSVELRFLEHEIRRGRKVYTQVRAVVVIAELQTAKVANFQRKIQLSGFSAYPEG